MRFLCANQVIEWPSRSLEHDDFTSIRHCERSEAIQREVDSSFVDCFVASLFAMTTIIADQPNLNPL
jgi:hypothetical protein